MIVKAPVCHDHILGSVRIHPVLVIVHVIDDVFNTYQVDRSILRLIGHESSGQLLLR